MASYKIKIVGLDKLTDSFNDLTRKIGAAVNDELRYVTSKAHKDITSSTRPPYKTGFTRKSTGEEPGKAVFSDLAWARIWEFGGTVTPNGTPITFPKTEWMSKPMTDAFNDADDRLARRIDDLF